MTLTFGRRLGAAPAWELWKEGQEPPKSPESGNYLASRKKGTPRVPAAAVTTAPVIISCFLFPLCAPSLDRSETGSEPGGGEVQGGETEESDAGSPSSEAPTRRQP